jgi:sulfur carrier protein
VIVTINGEHREVPADATIATIVELLSDARSARGMAVALDGQVVPRGIWASTRLGDGDRVEVVVAIQGG